jgi:hypothetical protein
MEDSDWKKNFWQTQPYAKKSFISPEERKRRERDNNYRICGNAKRLAETDLCTMLLANEPAVREGVDTSSTGGRRYLAKTRRNKRKGKKSKKTKKTKKTRRSRRKY